MPRDAAGVLPVLTSREIVCPWCGFGATDPWITVVERDVGRAVMARQHKQRLAARREVETGEPMVDEPPIDHDSIRAAAKATCPACEKPFRVVRIVLDEHVIQGARSDQDEEYLAWKARQATAAGGGP